MRTILLTGLLLLGAGCVSNEQPQFHHGPPGHRGGDGDNRYGPRGGGDRGPRGRLFISPMGEPFRSARGGADPQDLWFDQADTNHDGVLTRAEFEADAKRFFALLDRGHDGEIDPDDIEYYETVLAPEIRVGGAGGGRSSGAARGGGMGGGRHGGGGMGSGGMGGGHRGGRGGGSSQGGGESGGEIHETYGKQGAARYSYFDYPEPVTVADTNFNRGVDPVEFQNAADARFALLDKNGDGRLERKELPHISAAPDMGGRPGGHGRHGGPGVDAPVQDQPKSSP